MHDPVYERAFSYTEALMDKLYFDFKIDLNQGVFFYQNATPEEREHDFQVYIKEYENVVQLEKKQGEEGKQGIMLFTYLILNLSRRTNLFSYHPFDIRKKYSQEEVNEKYTLCSKSTKELFKFIVREKSLKDANALIFTDLLFLIICRLKIAEFNPNSFRLFIALYDFSIDGMAASETMSYPSFECFPFVKFLRNPPAVPHPCSHKQWNMIKDTVLDRFYSEYKQLSVHDKLLSSSFYPHSAKELLPHGKNDYFIRLTTSSYDEKIMHELKELQRISDPEIFSQKIAQKCWTMIHLLLKTKNGIPLTQNEEEKIITRFSSAAGHTAHDYFLFPLSQSLYELTIREKLDQLKETNQEIEKANLALEQEIARTGRILAEMSHQKTHTTNSVNTDRMGQIWEAIPNLENKELIFDLNTEKRDYLLRDFSLIDKQYSKEPSDWVEIFQEQLELDPGNGTFLTMLDEALYHLLHHFQQDRSWIKNPQLQEVFMPLNSCAFLNPLQENRHDYLIKWFGDAYYPVNVAIEGTWSDAYFSRYSYENDQENVSLAYIQWVEIFTIVWEYLVAKGAKNSENQLNIRFFQEEQRYGIFFEQKNIENQHHLPWQELGLCHLKDFLEDLNEGEALKEEGDKITLYLPLTILQEKQGDKKI